MSSVCKKLICALAALVLAGLHSLSAELVELAILQTTDIHGFITHSDTRPAGGWLRLAGLVREIRREHGEERVLLIDCGDTIAGNIETLPSRGRLAVAMINALDYDVWVPGNHELDFGSGHLLSLVKSAEDRVLCGNLALASGETPELVKFPAWRLIERGGARVAVIGMTASYLENWFWGDSGAGFAVSPALESIAAVMPAIRQARPDAIILAIHQGWLPDDRRGVNEITPIADRFPDIDLILGGHTHWGHAGRRLGENAWYVQAGSHADAVAMVEMTVDTKAHRVTRLESRLLPADTAEPEEFAAASEVGAMLADARDFIGQKIGVLAAGLAAGRVPGVNSATSELISAAIAEKTGVTIVVHGKLSDKSFPAGDFSERELFALVPYENTVGTLILTVNQLRAVINEQVANRGSYVACGIHGIHAVLDQEGRVEKLLLPNGQPAAGKIKVAFNSYSLAGGGGRFPFLRKLAADPKCAPVDTGLSTRDIVREFIRRHTPVTGKPRNWFALPADAETAPPAAPAD